MFSVQRPPAKAVLFAESCEKLKNTLAETLLKPNLHVADIMPLKTLGKW